MGGRTSEQADIGGEQQASGDVSGVAQLRDQRPPQQHTELHAPAAPMQPYTW